MSAPMNTLFFPGTWLADTVIALVLFVYLSILYKANPAYTVIENLAVGAIAGNRLVGAVQQLQTTVIPPLLAGNEWYWIPVIFGLFFFSVFGRGRWRSLFRIMLVLAITRDLSYQMVNNFAWARGIFTF